MRPSPFHLAPRVHWCMVHGFCVLLQEDQDRYLSIPATEFSALLSCLRRTGVSDQTGLRDFPPELTSLATELLARGILAPGPQLHETGPTAPMPKPSHLVSATRDRMPLREAARHAAHFFRACAAADRLLRFAAFREITSRIRVRNSAGPPGSIDSMLCLSQAFHALRPLYPRNYLCLFDSLALLEFLAARDLFPRWVFGVNVDPFDAHCWVQYESIVLCDTHRFGARWYSQILVV